MDYNTPNNDYNQPIYTNNNNIEEDHLKGMAIASIVLGVVSILCCCCYGLNLILAIIGLILGIIATIKGTGKGRSLGIVGLVISGISFAIGLVLICLFASTIDWSQVTPENLETYKYIDPNDEEQ
ncbi:MAG: DUF4190 domain-containing protein, partial [Eubacterium sp.]|nr:DUF4190 domain-containing protein [Eubacterium sp.]